MPPIDCAHIDAQLTALTYTLQGRVPPPPPHVRPSEQVRERMAHLRTSLAQRHISTAERQWANLSTLEKRVLVAVAALTDCNPGESAQSIAAREWPEFVPAERAAIGQAIRHLRIRLGRLDAIAGIR